MVAWMIVSASQKWAVSVSHYMYILVNMNDLMEVNKEVEN